MLQNGKKYSEIMEKYNIGKSSLSEYKKKLNDGTIKIEKTTEPTTEPTTELYQTKIDSGRKILENFESFSPLQDKKILSEIEFKMFKNASDLIYKSNENRYISNRAKGMLNALKTIKDVIDILEKRLGYK